MEPIVVWFGVVDHRQGKNHYAGASQEAVEAQLADYCREWAENQKVPLQPGDTDRDVIATYFDYVEDEIYDLVHLDVALQ